MRHDFNSPDRPSSNAKYLLPSLIIGLLMAVNPFWAMATDGHVVLDGTGFNPSDVTINVGESVKWEHLDPTGSVHWIKASDYQGHPCYDPTFVGGDSSSNTGNGANTDGLLAVHRDIYIHFFPAPGGDCYYRDILNPGMQGVVHVIVPGGNQPPTAVSLNPVNISTLPSVAQSFTAVYSDPDGWQNISDSSLSLSGSTHNELLRYNPQTNKFSLLGASGDCSPGNGATLSNFYLTLNCGSSSISQSGTMLTVMYNLTPQPTLSGAAYRLILAVVDQGGMNQNKDMGYWVVNRRPSAESVSPMNSMTGPGMNQTFVAVYSDPDGYENIAEANFYLAGGMHNEWLHYISAANIFTMMGTSAVCSPGDGTMLSNGFLTLDCSASTVSGWEHQLTITFYVTPQAPSSGINYNIFTGVSDHAGAAHGAFAGTWQIP